MNFIKKHLPFFIVAMFAAAAYGATVAYHIVGAGGPQNDTLILGFSTDNVRWGSVGTTAAAGSAQGSAAALAYTVNNVTGADGTKGVILPTAKAGQVVQIFNNSASNLKVYPASGETINAGSANANIVITNKIMQVVISTADGAWASTGY